MEGYLPLKLKSKEFDNDFSDFSLSYPATKIRRLDAELPPIIEDEECDIPLDFEQSVPQEQGFDSISSGSLRIEELPENEERAIVPFETPNPLLHSPPNFPVSVNPLHILGLKNQVLWSNSLKLPNNESSGCRAVVPWVPPQFPSTEMMEMDDASMDVEDGNMSERRTNVNQVGGMILHEGFHQWHCMSLHNTTTPLVWYR